MNKHTAHTPGPWTMDLLAGLNNILDDTIHQGVPIMADDKTICIIPPPSESGTGGYEQAANANLIEAAPAMLEALRLAFLELSLFDNTTGNKKDERCAFHTDLFPEQETRENFENVWQKIRAVIAQAEGRGV